MTPEINRQLNFLAGCPGGSTTVETKDLKEMLMSTGGSMLACGRLYNIIARHIGAGVYRVTLELA